MYPATAYKIFLRAGNSKNVPFIVILIAVASVLVKNLFVTLNFVVENDPTGCKRTQCHRVTRLSFCTVNI